MKVRIIEIRQEETPRENCEDFTPARLKWPKGATDYLYYRSNCVKYPSVLVGKHVRGWESDIKRKQVQGWNIKSSSLGLKNCFIFVAVSGKERYGAYDLANAIEEAYKAFIGEGDSHEKA